MRRQMKKSPRPGAKGATVSVGNRKRGGNNDTHILTARLGELINQPADERARAERRGVKTAFSTAWKTGNISLTISTLGNRSLGSVPASERAELLRPPSSRSLSVSLKGLTDLTTLMYLTAISHGSPNMCCSSLCVGTEDATKCTALKELPSEAPPKGKIRAAWLREM